MTKSFPAAADLSVALHARRRTARRGYGRPSAVLVAIVPGPSGRSIIVTRRTDTVRTHKGQYALPGGARDPSDLSIVDTALRETEEEVGLSRDGVSILGLLDDLPTVSGYIVTPVVGWVEHEPVLQPNPAEVATVVRVPLEALVAPPKSRSVVFDGLRRLVLAYDVDGHFIWGATARILRNLADVAKSIASTR